ncbi:MAG: hypothetical protein KAT28_02530 [Candidatus Aenigmarchaeota archaeon]|nr:hypothetical protein [Candidatus Aenigmarchaeota archaeon]
MTKSKYLGFGILVLVIIISLFFIIAFFSGSFQTDTYKTKTEKISYVVEKDISEEVKGVLSFSYDCKDTGNSIKCDGIISYIGEVGHKVSGAKLMMYCCTKKYSEECLLESNSVQIGTMDKERNQLSYTLECHYKDYKDIRAKLWLVSGLVYLPYDKCP